MELNLYYGHLIWLITTKYLEFSTFVPASHLVSLQISYECLDTLCIFQTSIDEISKFKRPSTDWSPRLLVTNNAIKQIQYIFNVHNI